jgi:hypothetical protein
MTNPATALYWDDLAACLGVSPRIPKRVRDRVAQMLSEAWSEAEHEKRAARLRAESRSFHRCLKRFRRSSRAMAAVIGWEMVNATIDIGEVQLKIGQALASGPSPRRGRPRFSGDDALCECVAELARLVGVAGPGACTRDIAATGRWKGPAYEALCEIIHETDWPIRSRTYFALGRRLAQKLGATKRSRPPRAITRYSQISELDILA